MFPDRSKGDPTSVPVTSDPVESAGPAHPVPAKEKKAAEELAAMILHDLSVIEGCPPRGVTVTVYGLNPWNALLTFGVAAGPVPNRADLNAFFDVITDRLKRLYNIKA